MIETLDDKIVDLMQANYLHLTTEIARLSAELDAERERNRWKDATKIENLPLVTGDYEVILEDEDNLHNRIDIRTYSIEDGWDTDETEYVISWRPLPRKEK